MPDRLSENCVPFPKPVLCSSSAMSSLVRQVSYALQRLNSAGRSATLIDLREVMREEFGVQAEVVSDIELRQALLALHGPIHPSAAMTRPGQSVTCSPMPDGWVPLDVFRNG